MLEGPLPRWRGALATSAILAIGWSAFAWKVADNYFVARADALIGEERRLASVRAHDLAGSIRRNLHYIAGIPDVIAQSPEVHDALARVLPGRTFAEGDQASRIARWSADSRLRELSRHLGVAQQRLDIDVLYVANAQGKVIAASDVGRAGLSIGTDVADREYFRAAREGRRSLQYAVGKATGIPGLFFASPVLSDGQFGGAVVAKIHMPNLSFLLDQSDAFLSDANGVIIMARNRQLELHLLPEADIRGLTASELQLRYQRDRLEPLPIARWPYGGDLPLVALAGSATPSVLTVEKIPEYNLQANVNSEIAAIPALRTDRLWFAVLLASAGGLLLTMVTCSAAYLRSLGESRARLWRKAHYDALTGLPNRELLRQRLAVALDEARTSGRPMALLVGDIDHFKQINDTLGHDIGDRVLRRTGEQIAACVHLSDTVARLGGDEFTVVLANVGDAATAASIAQTVVTRLGEPFLLGTTPVVASMSLGLAIYPDDAGDAAALLRRADEAMYAAKRQGGNRHARAAPEPA